MFNQDQLKKLFKSNNIDSQEILEKIIIYINNLEKWNKVINLTSKHFDIVNHIRDSLMFFKIIKDPSGNLIDIGSGNGFPGIILSIVCNKLNVTMIESNSKKSAFLKDTIIKLSLNATIINTNVLNFATQDKYRYATLRGLKCTKHLEKKIYSLLEDNNSILVIWAYPPPTLAYFKHLSSYTENNTHLHAYFKAQVVQQPR